MNKKFTSLRTEGSTIFAILTRSDRMILFLFVLLAIASFGVRKALQRQGSEAVIEVNGRAYARVDLLQPNRLCVPGLQGEVCILVEEGAVRVTASSCPHKVCIQRGKIRHAGDMIVCAPNRVIVRVVGHAEPVFDMITG